MVPSWACDANAQLSLLSPLCMPLLCDSCRFAFWFWAHLLAPLVMHRHLYCSFAIVMWEIWTRQIPWCELESSDVMFYFTLVKAIGKGQRPTVPLGGVPAPAGYEPLMRRCWAQDPALRPTAGEAASTLEGITCAMAVVLPRGPPRLYEGDGAPRANATSDTDTDTDTDEAPDVALLQPHLSASDALINADGVNVELLQAPLELGYDFTQTI